MVVLIGLDQLTKLGWRWFFPNLIVLNRAGPLGLAPWWVAPIGFLMICLWSWRRQQLNWGICLILAGGLSNLIDRFFWGGVVDFFTIGFLPVFNLADLVINLGLLIMVGAQLTQFREAKWNQR